MHLLFGRYIFETSGIPIDPWHGRCKGACMDFGVLANPGWNSHVYSFCKVFQGPGPVCLQGFPRPGLRFLQDFRRPGLRFLQGFRRPGLRFLSGFRGPGPRFCKVFEGPGLDFCKVFEGPDPMFY